MLTFAKFRNIVFPPTPLKDAKLPKISKLISCSKTVFLPGVIPLMKHLHL